MKRKFKVKYEEFEDDEIAHLYDSFTFNQKGYQQFTLRDVKEYVKELRFKKHKPVCSCFLKIWAYKTFEFDCHTIYRCNEYSDNTFLNDTDFDENYPIIVIPTKRKNCTCGQLEKLIIYSNFQKEREEDKKEWEEKERKNKEYYDRRFREEKLNHQNEIDRLQKLMNKQQKEDKKLLENQNQQHQNEISRIKEENKEKFEYFEQQRIQERNENQERLKTIENERQNERDETQKKFDDINKERKRERKLYKQRFDTLEQTLEEKDKQLRKNTKKLEENEKLKLYIEKCQKYAENEFISKNNKIYENYLENNKIVISEEIGKKLKQLIFENITMENINEDLIFKIVKQEKFPKNVKDLLEERIINLNNENMNINISSFNIIIIGNTGVGKSTLLNKVLKEKLAKTDFGDVCTMGPPKLYESENAKGIRIWDSRGIENGKYNLETAFSDIKNTIENLIKENDPNKFIHCIWYCIKSNRFTEEEADNLKRCYDSYIEKLPIIVVFTQSENQIETDKMMEKVKNKLENTKKLNGFDDKKDNDIKILKVLAEDYQHDFGTIKSFGIYHLMEQTYESAKLGIERACIHSLMEQGQNILKEEFDENIRRLKTKIFENQNVIKENKDDIANEQPNNNLLDNILNEEKKQKNNFNINNIDKFDYNNFRNFCKIFSRQITKNLLLKDIISEETTIEIDKVIENEADKVKQFFEKIFEEQSEKTANNLAEELIDYVSKLETKYQISNLSSKYNYNELKRQAKINIIKIFKPVIEDIIYREISQIIFQNLYGKISKELSDCFRGLLKSHKVIREIFTSKGKEISLICLKKIKNMMDYPNDDYEKRNPKKNKEKEKKSKYEDLGDDDDDDN